MAAAQISILSHKNGIKFGTWSLAFLGYILKKRVVTSALTAVKRGRQFTSV